MSKTEVCSIATIDKYTIAIFKDDEPDNPRNWSNLGHMMCWHKSYNLGDDNPYNNVEDFMQSLVINLVSTEEIIAYGKSAKGSFKIEDCNGEDCDEEIYSVSYFGYPTWFGEKHKAEWNHDRDYYKSEIDKGYYIDEILENASMSDCEKLLENKIVILPLYLYDHSGITMSTGSFNDRWDSGQVGFIYATYDEIKKEFGVEKVTDNEIKRAYEILEGEVKTYDDYLTGNVYGFNFYDFDDILDSCYGYYPNHDKSYAEEQKDMVNEIVDNVAFIPNDVREDLIEKFKIELINNFDYKLIDMDDYFESQFVKKVTWSVR
jgi:hypothetical protein